MKGADAVLFRGQGAGETEREATWCWGMVARAHSWRAMCKAPVVTRENLRLFAAHSIVVQMTWFIISIEYDCGFGVLTGHNQKALCVTGRWISGSMDVVEGLPAP